MKKMAVILFAFIVGSGCHKGGDTPQNDFCQDGFIRNTGNPAADGYGWVFRPVSDSTKFFILENLADDLKTDNLPVNACLYNTGKQFSCRCVQPPFYYHINSIKKR